LSNFSAVCANSSASFLTVSLLIVISLACCDNDSAIARISSAPADYSSVIAATVVAI